MERTIITVGSIMARGDMGWRLFYFRFDRYQIYRTQSTPLYQSKEETKIIANLKNCKLVNSLSETIKAMSKWHEWNVSTSWIKAFNDAVKNGDIKLLS